MTNTTERKSFLTRPFVRTVVLTCAALAVTLPASAGVRIGGGFGYGPAFGPWSYGYPYAYGAYPINVHPNAGEVKLDTKVKDADVYINGAFAGRVGDLKTMWMAQGAYNFEIRSPGRAPFAEQVYVSNGKTIHIHPELRVEPKS